MHLSMGNSFFSVLKDRNYRYLWTAGTITGSGEMSEILVSSWLVLQITGSPWQVALVGLSRTATMFSLSLLAGAIGDRLDRRKLMMTANAACFVTALTVLLLLAFGDIQPWHLFAAAGIRGSTRALDNTSRRALMFLIVGPKRLIQAISLEHLGLSSGRIVGPILMGILLQLDNTAMAATSVLAVGYIASFSSLALLRMPPSPHPKTGHNVFGSIGEGLKFAATSPPIAATLTTSIIMNLLFQYQLFIPVIAEDFLHIGPALMGLLAASDGMGKVTGSMLMGNFGGSIKHHGRVFLIGSLGVAVFLLGFALSPWFILSFALLFCLGVSQIGFSTMQSSILLIASPPSLHSRVGGAQQLAVGTGQLGTMELGAIASLYNVPVALAVNAIGVIALLVVIALLMPALRRPIKQVVEEPTLWSDAPDIQEMGDREKKPKGPET